jgi:hypothetical protein
MAIGNKQCTTPTAMSDVLIAQLCQQFITAMEKRWQFEFQPGQMGSKKAVNFVRRELNIN